MQQISSSQASPEVPINENFETLLSAAIYGKRHQVTTGLTWGYYGGRWGGTLIADGTVALTPSATNYLTVDRSTGVFEASTSSTDWDDVANFARVYKIATGAAAVSAVEDHRAGPGGLLTEAPPANPPDYIEIQVACSDMITPLTTGAGKGYFRAPRSIEVQSVRASLFTASSSGGITIDINVNGASILDTLLTIDASEKTSLTAATPFNLASGADLIDDDDEITIDIDGAGTDAAGLIVTILGLRV